MNKFMPNLVSSKKCNKNNLFLNKLIKSHLQWNANNNSFQYNFANYINCTCKILVKVLLISFFLKVGKSKFKLKSPKKHLECSASHIACGLMTNQPTTHRPIIQF
jgi:hypothetical protein